MKNIWAKYIFIIIMLISSWEVLGQNASIESVSPKKGYAGQLVDIKGTGLSGSDKVFFGSMEGEIISVNDQLIEARVPAGATYDNVLVYNSSTGLYSAGKHFLLSYGGEQGIERSDFDDPQTNFDAQSGLYDITICDIDGDGKNDIVGANSKSTQATILRNISTPTDIKMVNTTLNLGTVGLNSTSGDLNGDGKPEIIFSEGNDGNRLLILVNNSDPNDIKFSSLETETIDNSSTKRVTVKDMDLDGKPDLVVSDQTNNKVYILKNTTSGGNISFSTDILELIVDNAESTAGLDVEDINGDGKPDIITNQFLTDRGGFYIATNKSSPGNLSFDNFVQFDTEGTLVNLKVGDLNNDDKPDIVATLFLSSSVVYFLNESSGAGGQVKFGAPQNLSTERRPWGLDFGDVDGDGNIDIVAATIGEDKSVTVLNNTGGGSNFSKTSIPVDFINRNIKLADIDGDSKPDIVFSSVDDESNNITSSKISILRNNRCITPIITPEGPVNACVGKMVRLEAQKLDGITYEWKQDGNVVKNGPENFIEFDEDTATGSYTVAIITENGACAEVSEPVEVTISTGPDLDSPELTSNAPVCAGGTLTLTSTDVGATKYEWRGPEDFTATGISIDVPNFAFNKSGRYYLDVYSGSCITETKSIVAGIISSPNFFTQQSGEGAYCVGDSVGLSVTPVDPDFIYQWYEGSSAIEGATSTTYNPTTSGNYYAEITDQVNTFCPKIYSDTLEVKLLEEPQVSFSLPLTVCIQVPVPFENESQVADASLAQYNWDFGDGNTSDDQNPTHVYNSAGTFEVSLEVSYDGFSTCQSEFSQEVTVNGALNFAINASASTICEGDSIVLSIDENFESYEWNTGSSNSSITVTESGTYSVMVTDENGCSGSSEIAVNVSALPEVELFTADTVVGAGDTIVITADGLSEHFWFADSVSLEFTEDEIEFSPVTTTTFRVEGTDENGCFGSAEITITVEDTNIGDRLTPMRFFSPNNDAIAQFWEVQNIQFFSQCGVEIYDQQGNKIYESFPYNNDWEGTTNGSPIPDGVYYFVIKCEEQGIVKSGSITLLR